MTTWIFTGLIVLALLVIIWQWYKRQELRLRMAERQRQFDAVQVQHQQELAAQELLWQERCNGWQRDLQHTKDSATAEQQALRQQHDEQLRQQETLWLERQQSWETHKKQLVDQHAKECLARQREAEAQAQAQREAAEALQKHFAASKAEQEQHFAAKIAALKDEFKALSEQILHERATAMVNLSREQLGAILTPLNENIGRFRTAVDLARDKGIEMNASLKSSLDDMFRVTQNVGQDASKLAAALRGNSKIQGDWGEMVLEDILSRSGLQARVHYSTQETIRDNAGAPVRHDDSDRLLRPDVIVRYPDKKAVVIDSKVSLTAYLDYMNAEPDSDEARAALERHLRSVRQHVDELARKNYPQYLPADCNAVDYVIMFMPNEASYHLAMCSEPSLWQRAFEKRVLLVSPVNLMALLHMIRIAWTRAEQERNQQDIIAAAQILLDRAMSFYDDFAEVGKCIENTHKAYDAACKRLRGDGRTQSMLNAGKKIEKLGVRLKKQRSIPAALLADSDDADNNDDDPQKLEQGSDSAEAENVAPGAEDNGELPAAPGES